MTDERMNEIWGLLSKPEKMKMVLEEGPIAAAAAFTAEGYDFSADELNEAVRRLNEMEMAQNGAELDEEALENVAGGFLGVVIATGAAALATYMYIKRKRNVGPGQRHK